MLWLGFQYAEAPTEAVEAQSGLLLENAIHVKCTEESAININVNDDVAVLTSTAMRGEGEPLVCESLVEHEHAKRHKSAKDSCR